MVVAMHRRLVLIVAATSLMALVLACQRERRALRIAEAGDLSFVYDPRKEELQSSKAQDDRRRWIVWRSDPTYGILMGEVQPVPETDLTAYLEARLREFIASRDHAADLVVLSKASWTIVGNNKLYAFRATRSANPTVLIYGYLTNGTSRLSLRVALPPPGSFTAGEPGVAGDLYDLVASMTIRDSVRR
ncbi:MAG: hypothetical protein HY248_05305 [Fimbriimonas ginsengisoli]|uniref:Uncharacterized protein n=1 Tax=Fimbriimonas ginsengisoli TaxID=1005039 RepID=A0A931PUL4_FIMGI|nr:hypothetical protein [Fimbriimonas ginsengisoli]MBI3721952.1 hypothetical protein [Fimbriimonas ginsengisoli]